VSENSGNGAFGVPILTSYRVEWDDDGGEWVATHERLGTILRGKDQAELTAARNRGVVKAANELLEIGRYAQANGYTPPPRS